MIYRYSLAAKAPVKYNSSKKIFERENLWQNKQTNKNKTTIQTSKQINARTVLL